MSTPAIRVLSLPGMIPWDAIGAGGVIFLAGDTEWKLSGHAARITREAKRRGLRVHMGRVNSRRRLDVAEMFGCDSADGTYLSFGPDRNLPTLLGWLDDMHRRPSLFAAEAS
jgi:hypothetical protein